MRITEVKPYLTSNGIAPAVYLKIATDEGLVGYGEGTINSMPRAVYGLLQDLRDCLIGQDPQRIEHLWQACLRRLFYRGGPATGAALAAIDMALWDIKGKALDMPVYQLLGGLARDKVRLYGHVTGRSADEIAANAQKLVAQGITAVRFRGFHTYDDIGLHDHPLAVRQQVEYMEAIRAAVGDEVDILLECHGRYDLEWAVALAKQVERYQPFWIEDPMRHENPRLLAQLRQQTPIPLAHGERQHDKWEFRELIENRYVDYLRPDICHCGGLTEIKKIAAMAETYFINLAPHNTQGPLGTAAGLHASLAINNVALLEAPWVSSPPPSPIVGPWPTVRDGYALPPQGPGLGITFDEAAAEEDTFVPRPNAYLKAPDGSLRDW
jgi:L-alanine-DL-glutamate epimerase-like enolase superfamily enzyme